MDHRPQVEPALRSQSGASLISILISVAIIGFIAEMAAVSFKRMGIASRRINSTMAGKEGEDALVSAMTGAVNRTALYQWCGEPNFKPIDWIAAFNPITAANIPANAPSSLRDAISTACSPLLRNASRYGNCYEVAKNSGAVPANLDQAAFLSYVNAYIVMDVQYADLRVKAGNANCVDTSVACPVQPNTPEAGVAYYNAGVRYGRPGYGYYLNYQIHWTIRDGAGGLLHRQKKGNLRINLPGEKQTCFWGH